VSEWIDVKDRLPTLLEDVLVCVIYEGNDFGVVTNSYRDGYPHWTWEMGSAKNYSVTHWMPLPEPPK
jgi:hypothetical protein